MMTTAAQPPPAARAPTAYRLRARGPRPCPHPFSHFVRQVRRSPPLPAPVPPPPPPPRRAPRLPAEPAAASCSCSRLRFRCPPALPALPPSGSLFGVPSWGCPLGGALFGVPSLGIKRYPPPPGGRLLRIPPRGPSSPLSRGHSLEEFPLKRFPPCWRWLCTSPRAIVPSCPRVIPFRLVCRYACALFGDSS